MTSKSKEEIYKIKVYFKPLECNLFTLVITRRD